MVRSEENQPTPAVLRIAERHQRALSQYASVAAACAVQ
jgi:hypothetical protein